MKCPLCTEEVYDLPRHLRSSKHKWTQGASQYARAKLGIRVRNANKQNMKITNEHRRKPKAPRPFKQCTLCEATVTRLDVHMRRMHNKKAMKEHKEAVLKFLETGYKKWMNSPDSGGLSDVTKNKNALLLNKVYLHQNISSLKNLLDENLVMKLFTANIDDNTWERKSAGTYMYNLVTFFKYLATNSFKITYESENGSKILKMGYTEIRDMARMMRDSTSRWAKSWVNDFKADYDEKWNREMKNLLTEDEIEQIKTGNLYARMIELKVEMKELGLRNDQIIKNFLDIRNYLIANIFARNFHRSAVIHNFTMNEFRDLRVKKGRVICDVKNHKTSKQYGLASIIVDLNFFKIMEMYVVFREKLCDMKSVNSPFFFITRECTKLDSSSTDAALKAAVKMENIKKAVSSNIFRKTAATAVSEDLNDRSDLSSLMMHSASTAKQHYQRFDRDEARIRAEKRLNKTSQQEHSFTDIQPDPSSADIQPGPSSADIQPDPSSADIQPGPSSADIQPGPSSADIQPDPSSADIQPGPSSADIQPGPSPADTQPDSSPADTQQDSSYADTQQDSSVVYFIRPKTHKRVLLPESDSDEEWRSDGKDELSSASEDEKPIKKRKVALPPKNIIKSPTS